MFHLAPSISAAAVVLAAVILVLAALSLGSSLHGTAHAQEQDPHPDPAGPVVRIESVTNVESDIVREGTSLSVTLRLDRAPTAADVNAKCYHGAGEDDDEKECIEGGITVMDTYNNHLWDDGDILSDELIAFVFRNGEVEEKLTVWVDDDDCVTPGRTIKISINEAFRHDQYGYDADQNAKEFTYDVNGNDEENGQYVDRKKYGEKECLPVDDGEIEVIDGNHGPRFVDGDLTTRSVDETDEVGQPVGEAVVATDADNDTLTYTLSGDDAESFDIDDTNGQIRTKDALDYEGETTSYSVTISVSDGENLYGDPDPAVDDTIDVTIEVTDVNEPPAFSNDAPATLEVAENTAAETNVGDPFTATDPDAGETLTYSLGGTDAAFFDIDDATGQLKTKADLNHESKGTYSVTVQVSDGRNDAGDDEQSPVADTTHAVTITVTDVDEDGTITFSADPPSAGTALTATLNDDDAPISGETWVWETSDDQNSWTIITGAETNSYIPQQADINKYLHLTVTYTDSFGGSKTATAATGQVASAPPTNLQPAFATETDTRSVPENTPPGTEIGDAIEATDDDDSTLTYSLGGTDAASFEYDTSTNKLKSRVDLDYETTTDYSVTLSVHDGKDPWGNPSTTVDDTITVTVTVIDMVVPAIPAKPTVEATTGPAAGLDVSWTAIDPEDDSPVEGYDVQYRVKDTPDTDPWLTDNVTISGTSATITGLAYSTIYEVQVRSKNSEGGSGWSPPGEGSIPSKLDVSFSSSSYTVTEGGSETITVYVSPTADRDLSIPVAASSSNAESGDYAVNGLTSGKLSISSGSSSGTFTISTTDDTDRNDETVSLAFGSLQAAVGTASPSTATLTIDDTTPAPQTPVNNGGNNNGDTSSKTPGGSSSGGGSYTPPANQAPTFNDGTSTERWVAEKSPEGTDIGHPVRATNADKDSLTFSLGGTDASSFSIGTGTGQLKTKAELDFEIRDTYSVTVSVTDGQGGTDSIAVTIRVTDVVDVPVTDEDHQVVVLVDPDDETEASTPGGDATVTFPEGTRPGPFFVLIDSSSDNCDWTP